MEQTDNKLNVNNPALTAQIFSRLIQNAVEKNEGKQLFAYLKGKCLGNDDCISDTARLSVLHLIERGVLEIDQVLAEFVTSISTSSNTGLLVKIITNILHLQLCQNFSTGKKPKKYKQFQLVQHPLVKILQSDCLIKVQTSIYNEIYHGCYMDTRMSVPLHRLYKPLYLYCLCSPSMKPELAYLREKIWNFLMTYDLENNTTLIFTTCAWLQIENRNSELSSSLLNEVFQNQLLFEESLENIDYLILTQILVIHNMIMNNGDCRMAIKGVLLILPESEFCHHNLVLLILSKSVMICSPLYLEDLLQLCFHFASYKICQTYSFLALKSVLLHWLASPCLLSERALKIAKDILKLNDKVCQERPQIKASTITIDKFHYLIFCNPELFLALQLGVKIECTGKEDIPTLIESFEEAPLHFLKNSFTFLLGLLLDTTLSVEDRLKVLRMIVKCSAHYLEFLPAVLMVVLYVLSNSVDNLLHFELLKVLPLMARVKENMPKVIATIQAISKQSSQLGNFALRLMYDTWEIENKCYSALENVALNLPDPPLEGYIERNICKAFVFKKLSEKRPELYGKDMVAYLSKILNECTTVDGSVPTALALEGIRHLCKAEVIDILTTWETLSPKFKNDKRIAVVKSLCQLISEIPNLEYTQSYEKLNDEVLKHLWNYVLTSNKEEIVAAALQAIATFGLDLISLNIPSVYLDEGSCKKQFVGGQEVVPGKTWLKFLRTCKSRDAARHFITQLVAAEIDNFLKYVYQVKSQREPENYSGLPPHSIVRALGEYLKRNCSKVNTWKNSSSDWELFSDCLQILSSKYSKPLPPLDWCFLQELVHSESLKPFCLDLASHQAILSGSARRLMENYIVAISEDSKNSESLHVYRNLKYLANSIQPVVLQPFFENTLHCMLLDAGGNGSFELALGYLKEVLADVDVQDVNKHIIEDVLTEIVLIMETSCKTFALLLPCIPSFSQTGQEKVARCHSETISDNDFLKIVKIRCYITKHTKSESPLVWLNELFDLAKKNSIKLNFYADDLTDTFKKLSNHEDTPMWLNELFGEIQAKVADRLAKETIGYFCDILALAIVHLAGFNVILPQYESDRIKYFLPAALTYLLDEPMWSICTVQVLEWLHHMNTAENIPENYQKIFGWALSCLRHQEEFSKSSRWMKYLDCKIYTTDNVL